VAVKIPFRARPDRGPRSRRSTRRDRGHPEGGDRHLPIGVWSPLRAPDTFTSSGEAGPTDSSSRHASALLVRVRWAGVPRDVVSRTDPRPGSFWGAGGRTGPLLRAARARHLAPSSLLTPCGVLQVRLSRSSLAVARSAARWRLSRRGPVRPPALRSVESVALPRTASRTVLAPHSLRRTGRVRFSAPDSRVAAGPSFGDQVPTFLGVERRLAGGYRSSCQRDG